MKTVAILEQIERTSPIRGASAHVRKCTECRQMRPLTSFLPAPHGSGGRLETCLGCIRTRAERDRLDRERRFAEAAARAASNAEKTCRTCKRTKPVTDFAKHRLARDGHRHDCRSCVQANKAKVKPKTPEQIRLQR